MRRFSSDNNNFPYDNNVLVLDMVLGSLWGVPQPINWDNVAKLVPGFTSKECACRFEELKTTGGFPHVDNQCNALTEGSTSPSEGPPHAAGGWGGGGDRKQPEQQQSDRLKISGHRKGWCRGEERETSLSRGGRQTSETTRPQHGDPCV
ncbi:hypothetical protein CesoFtcFv8_020671 [Champsocephalus esox]|uniref:Uncharacterized protein n=1 Tax=Champsocephalus esox TaxID=159716 RepID=A0AAN8BBA7_9TELE|nr:hypothetical protein CesoFtcFv8_020671 [Champsocephalus esox]